MYGNFLLIYLNWREICPLRMPKDLLCFLPNRGFVLKDTVCWPLPQDSKSRIGLSWGLYLDDKWYIVDLCHWPAIWFLGVCCVYSNGIPDPGKQMSRPLSRQSSSGLQFSRGWLVTAVWGNSYLCIPCSTGGTSVVVCDNLILEVMILAINSCKIICYLFFFTLQFGLNRAEICPSLDRFEFWLFGSDFVGRLGA